MSQPPDPDVSPAAGDEVPPARWDVLAAIAVGGVLGAEARYGLAEALPHAAGSWPWATLLTNVAGSALLGVLMAVLAARPAPHRLARPFLGVGVLGGFTTFSTFALDLHALLRTQHVPLALGYAAASVFGCVGACAVAGTLTDRVRRPSC